jgi:hypothetical protein
MPNKWFYSLLLTLVLLAPPAHAARVNLLITFVTTNLPIRIMPQSTPEDRLLIQSRHGNVGLVTVLLGVPVATACSLTATPSQISAELGPGSTLQPGGSFSDPQGANGDAPPDFEDMGMACVVGTAGDQVIVTFWGQTR